MRSRCTGGLPVRTGYHHLFFFEEDSFCTTVRWGLGCSETVMVNIWRIVYRGSADIVVGRLIDANDHMYIENPTVGENQFSPFVNVFFFFFLGGGTPFFRPLLLYSRYTKTSYVLKWYTCMWVSVSVEVKLQTISSLLENMQLQCHRRTSNNINACWTFCSIRK